MTEPDDAELWRRIRTDDADAFGLLFERHGARLHAFALRRVGDPDQAEDVVAVVFLEAWRRRRTVEIEHASALPWLYGVATNVVRTWRRSRRRHQAALQRFDALPAASQALVDRQVEAVAEAARVIDEVRDLPVRERDVLVLSVWEGLSHAEVADALGISVGTVKSRLSRARTRLDPAGRAARRSATPDTTPLILKET